MAAYLVGLPIGFWPDRRAINDWWRVDRVLHLMMLGEVADRLSR
ncbi:hypothetical protein [Paenibacillus methanolicus]|nr:hypothetical protein [Paenibacillus methanolicus]